MVDHPGPDEEMMRLADGTLDDLELSEECRQFRPTKRGCGTGLKLVATLLVDRTTRERPGS